MRLVVLIVIAAFGCVSAHAQGPGSPEAQAAANDLAKIMSVETIGQMTKAMTAQVWPKLEAGLRAKVDAETLAEVRAEFEKALQDFTVEAMTDAPAIYARHFSAPELREMTAFYRSPTGAKALQLMPQVMAEYFGAILPRTQAFERDLQARIVAVMTRRGYNKQP
jgi:hypothetical protein